MTSHLIPQFNQFVKDWINDVGPAEFNLDGMDFELIYNDGRYSVQAEGVEVAWNHKDFAKVGEFLLNNN
jgi:hypothetical protein